MIQNAASMLQLEKSLFLIDKYFVFATSRFREAKSCQKVAQQS